MEDGWRSNSRESCAVDTARKISDKTSSGRDSRNNRRPMLALCDTLCRDKKFARSNCGTLRLRCEVARTIVFRRLRCVQNGPATERSQRTGRGQATADRPSRTGHRGQATKNDGLSYFNRALATWRKASSLCSSDLLGPWPQPTVSLSHKASARQLPK
jgi:hypothetical protein